MNRILSKKFLLRVYSSCFLNRIEVQSKYNVYFIILISAFEFHCIHSHSYAQDLLYRSALVSISIDEEYSDKSRFLTSRVFNVMATFKVFFKLLAEGNLVHATILSHANPLQRKYFLRTLHEEISTKRYLVRFSRFLHIEFCIIEKEFIRCGMETKKKRTKNYGKQEAFLTTRLFA